ncbi:MAG: NTP transferase domain-containing protein, partial [Lachnospiraceae bacterium]|nr:NTP transferase domain-containing protein [Lachnospiraceae bacterium]
VVDEDRRVLRILFDEGFSGGRSDLALKNTPVVIMAGGSGTRLYPYTKILPKPLIPIGDVPIVERIIRQFQDFGCHEFHLVVNVKKNMIKAYFNEIEKDYDVFYADEDEPLGTGGGLYLLKNKIKDTFILSNCDILVRDDFGKMMASHKKHQNMITMVSSLKTYPIPYGVVHLGDDGKLETIEEKPQMSFLTNTGVYIIEPEVLEMIPEHTFMGFPDIIEKVKAEGQRVGIYPVSEHAWLDMGQMDTLEDMRERLEDAAEYAEENQR